MTSTDFYSTTPEDYAESKDAATLAENKVLRKRIKDMEKDERFLMFELEKVQQENKFLKGLVARLKSSLAEKVERIKLLTEI